MGALHALWSRNADVRAARALLVELPAERGRRSPPGRPVGARGSGSGGRPCRRSAATRHPGSASDVAPGGGGDSSATPAAAEEEEDSAECCCRPGRRASAPWQLDEEQATVGCTAMHPGDAGAAAAPSMAAPPTALGRKLWSLLRLDEPWRNESTPSALSVVRRCRPPIAHSATPHSFSNCLARSSPAAAARRTPS